MRNALIQIPDRFVWRWSARGAALFVGMMLILLAGVATAAAQRSFASPQAAVDALMEAVRTNDEAALHAMFGPDSSKLLSSGDAVADAKNRAAFSKAYDEANRLDIAHDDEATLVVGKDEWPMPIPLVRDHGRWRFDTKKGADEILARRIGRNELSAIKVCLAIVAAELDYSTHDLDGDGLPQYASRFVSAPGKRDGLYWPTAADQTPSPLGALLAGAADEGYPGPDKRTLEPYHGYYYRILVRQGNNAPGGAREYLVKGKLIGGFGLLAYPARYGASGVMSFMVNHDGVIYEKNLGPGTQAAARAISAFDPDSSWKRSAVPK